MAMAISRAPAPGALGGGDEDITGPVVADTDWHHYGYVRSGQNHKLFFDGAVVADLSFSGTAADTTGEPLVFGVLRPAEGAIDPQFFGGAVDEVMLFDLPLSDAEVKAIFDAG